MTLDVLGLSNYADTIKKTESESDSAFQIQQDARTRFQQTVEE